MSDHVQGSDEVILHVSTPGAWSEAQAAGSLREPSLESVGFIHCCDPDQLAFVLDTFYADAEDDLLVLTIDPTRVKAALVREVGDPSTGEEFPHLYGPLNVDAVTGTRVISTASVQDQPRASGASHSP